MKRIQCLVWVLCSSFMGAYAQWDTTTISNEVSTTDEIVGPVLRIGNEIRIPNTFMATDPTIGTLDNSGYGINIHKTNGIGFALNGIHRATITPNGEFYLNGGWVRVKGDRGFYFQDYGGGFFMKDNLWIRTFGDKNFYHNTGIMRTDGVFQVGGNGDRFLVDGYGNVGIGTTTPLEKLEVNGKMYLNSGVDDDGIYWARHYMTMGTIPGSYNHNVFMLKPGGSSRGSLHSRFDMYVANSETDHDCKVRIHTRGNSFFNGGNVGIGTTVPDAKLAVKGTVHAEEVKVDLSVPGPDYVFTDGYGLRSLEAVQDYIEEHGHLPNIPSAREMEENGIRLGEMNMKLLEKVEELTLYTLEQEKKIKRLENLEKEIIELKKRIKN